MEVGIKNVVMMESGHNFYLYHTLYPETQRMIRLTGITSKSRYLFIDENGRPFNEIDYNKAIMRYEICGNKEFEYVRQYGGPSFLKISEFLVNFDAHTILDFWAREENSLTAKFDKTKIKQEFNSLRLESEKEAYEKLCLDLVKSEHEIPVNMSGIMYQQMKKGEVTESAYNLFRYRINSENSKMTILKHCPGGL